MDEVHASDDYMTELTAEVVRRHVASGGHALLMSATLGAEAARRYVGGAAPGLASASLLPYPLIRWRAGVEGDPVLAEVTQREDERPQSKEITLEVAEAIDDDATVAAMAARHARRGAKVLVIRNTVDGCVNVRRLLAAELPGGHAVPLR